MMSYDELLKHVETLKRENTNLQRELTDNSSHLQNLEHETNSMRETWCQGQGSQARDIDNDYSFNDEILCREHMATYEENPDLEPQTQVDPVANSNPKSQGHQRSQGQQSALGGAEKDEEKEIVELMKQLEQERSNLIQQIEAEEKNRKWYYDQMEMITRKIRSLPLGDNHSKQTRKHLEFEVSRLRDTMHESFGSNEQIGQRREVRVQRIRHVEMELAGLQKHREQMSLDQPDGTGLNRRRSSSDSTGSGGSGEEFEPEQVTMATQTEDANSHEQQTDKGNNYWQNIYHGTWPINKDASGQGHAGQGPQDLASVMSFTSTNTSSSHGSRPQNQGQGQGQGQQLPRQQQQPQQPNQQQQQHHQPIAVQQQIHPQQLGTKVEMVYGLLSMLGTHDKDDMSRTLLAMSSSQDSCIAMRQSGCMPLLIQLLHGSDKDSALLGNTRGSKAARARASAALHNIVHSHPDDKRGRREARVLRLLEQIRAHCDQLRESSSDEDEEGKDNGLHSGTMDHHPGPAIASLMKLSFDEEHRHAICTLGGLHAIAELLQVDTEVHGDTSEQYNITMRRYACMALTNLTFGDGTNKALLCSMKTSMESLMLQLFSTNEELCQVAASVVRNLSWKADLASKKMLREVSAVTSLMQSAMRVGKETTLKSILSALWNLSAHCSENKADICAVCGALEFLINTLTYKSPSKTTAIIENGGGILRNVSSHIAVREDYRKILRLHGCLQILLKHLRSPSLTIVSNACGTLWNLSARCAEDQQALWEMGAVNMLRNLVHSKHKMISMGSSAALKNLLAARPNMKNVDLNKQNSGNRPSLQARKQRALESEIDQNLSETCENVESPRDSPIENKKTDNGHFIYPVYPLLDTDQRRPMARGQFLPRSQSGDNALTLENAAKVNQRVSRSGSQDSVGSTHSDISHDRSRSNLAHKVAQNNNMGGSLDRNKDSPAQGQKKFGSDGRTERNPLGAPNSRILQVMQEVAMHAGLEGQNQQEEDHAVFKPPLPVMSYIRPQLQQQKQQPTHLPQSGYHGNMMSQQPAAMYQRYMMSNSAGSGSQMPQGGDNGQPEEDEKPLDYSLKYRENGQADYKPVASSSQSSTQGNYPIQSQNAPNNHRQYGKDCNKRVLDHAGPKQAYYNHPMGNHQRMQYNDAYAETDLDAPDQITDYSARYGVEYGTDQFARQQYGGQYGESDPNCADCKLEELRRYNDRMEINMEDDQLKTFCTEDTPYLSTATSMTDLSTAVKILEEAENNCPADGQQDFNNDEIQNFSSKYGENGNNQRGSPGQGQHQCQAQRHHDADKSSRSGSQTTDPQTGTTVITNYNLKIVEQQKLDSSSHQQDEECPERSFHDNRNDDGPPDQMKTYYEEGTPLCFSRVSSLSSLHSSEAADRQDKRGISGPLQSINETEDLNNSVAKMPPPPMTPMSYRQKMEGNVDGKSQITNEVNSTLAQRQMTLGQRRSDVVCMNGDSNEKEHKTVTFDDKEHVQETPMMFSRSTSLGSLSSFDTQSVHSSVFSEYSRRASEVVSPSELPDSPSETMPPSPRRTKSPERLDNKKQLNSARQELFPQNGPRQFTNSANQNAQKISPLAQLVRMNNLSRISNNETDSVCKSEAPVVYAEEGTPPVFDNLSEISGMLSDQYDINDKTLVEVKVSKDGQSSSNHSNQGSERYLTPNNKGRNTSDKPVSVDSIQLHVNQKEMNNQQRDPETQAEEKNQSNVTDSVKIEGQKNSDLEKRGQGQIIVEEDKGNASVSDVSEGEDDLLANIISSAMPNHSKKVRKSSSDSTARRKLVSSNKPDGGRGKGQGHSKSHGDSPPSKSGIPTSSKNSTKSQKSNTIQTSTRPETTVNKKKACVAPLQHRDLTRVTEKKNALDTSVDSVTSYADEDTPFNVSNTQSVINRSLSQQQQQLEKSQQSQTHTVTSASQSYSASDSAFQKAESLALYDEEEKCRTYATEDTPFSGSVPTSPRNDRKFKGGPLPPDMNQDCVTSFATEDTPFSGTAPGSPKFDRTQPFQPSTDMETDSIKCYQTEDTPFSGSTMGSPKMARNTKPAQNARVQNLKNAPEPSKPAPKPVNKPKQATVPPMLDFNQDILVSYATEDTPLNQSNLPSPKPTDQHPQFNNQSLQNMDFGDADDAVKTFATEGTPLNYSRTGSFSDLSSINTNFEEKVKIEPCEPVTALSQNVADDSHSDNSSLMEDSEELLSEIIQSAMPVGKPGKSQKVMDRKPEGAETKRQPQTESSYVKAPKSKVPAHFQPQRTSSLAQNNGYNQYGDSGDQVRTYAVEDTPANMSSATSLSDLTVDSSSTHNNAYNNKQPPSNQMTNPKASNSSTGQNFSYNTSENTAYGMSNDSVFLQSEFDGSSSLRVYKTEGTPQSFSCNESLSSLGIVDDDSSNPVTIQIKAIANTLTKPDGQAPKVIERSESRSSEVSNQSGKELERHVIGQSSEEQSIVEENWETQKMDEMKKFGVEDTPVCFSRNSSLSSIHDMKDDAPINPAIKQQEPAYDTIHRQPSKDQKSNYKMEHTPICFSRNSSLSSLSIHSDDDDDPEDIALLEDCITSALPPRTRPTREERHRNSHRSDATKSKNASNTNYTRNNQVSSQRNYSSADELETPTTHDSRYSNWRQQPHKSCDEIFRKPTLDARGRPCRRSRSQDSEKIPLKQHKDVSNKELAQNTRNTHKGSFDSLCVQNVPVATQNEEVEKQRQQIISESQNLTRSIEHQVRALTRNELSRSAEKSDEHESEKNESPTDEQNFFMMCSGITEISVESISKQSFPSSMAPDTDDDILDSSLMGSFRFEDEESMRSSRDTTLTERNTQRSCNSTLTEQGQLHPPRTTMEASITSEDERALAENANLIMAEMVYSRMGVSGSTVDDDCFIEHETLSLVSNEYMSDTASEASVTWSVSSDRTTSSDRTNTESENQPRRPRILKPGDRSERKQPQSDTEVKGVRGKRKPLYSSHSVAGMAPSSAVKADSFSKNRSQSVTTAGKTSPRSQQLNSTANAKKAHTLRTQPQACSTPVKTATGMKQTAVVKPTLPQRKSSLEQRSPSSKPTSSAKSTAIAGKSPKGGKSESGEITEKPRTLSKQGTFVKETSNKNAPVISSENSPVNLRQKKNSSSSSLQSHRNSSGSSRSNTSESLANDSFDSNPDQNSKISVSEKENIDSPVGEKKSKLRRSLGTSQLTNSRKSLNQSLSPATKIPSPSKTTLNKTGSNGNLKKTPGKQSQVFKSSSGTSLAKSNSGSSLTKTGSNSSLKKLDMKQSDSNTSLRNSRPSTPVSAVNNRKGTIPTTNNKCNDNNKKPSGNKTSSSKLPGLIRKDKNSDSKQKTASKLPVAKTKGKQKEDLNQSVNKREASPKPAINRNTVILSESSFDGLCRSSTYDKLNATNELSQIPNHDLERSGGDNNKNVDESRTSSKVFKEDTLDRTCRDMSKFEIGVEYNLDDAWATHVEKSIEVMSRSIEENKGQQSHLYGVEAELSKMDLSDSPTKRLSKSESMSEIELEYGSRVNSGTWTKKRSRNDSSLLPNADETSRTLPLKKRSESLNFSRMSSECLSPYDSDYDDTEVWIRRDDKMRCSDTTGKLKKKGLKGSSSFRPLKNVVSKVFGSKKVDKQSKSMIVTEKEQQGVRKDTKLNKSEIKATKAELKAEAKQMKAEQKALQKAEAKMLKASKKESKLIKNNKSGVAIGNKDNQCQNFNSSMTSLKKSAEDLIDIDKSDDEILENQSAIVYQTASLGRRQKFSVINSKPVNDISSSNYQYKSQSAEQLDQVRQSGSVNKIVNQSFSDRTEQNRLNKSQSSVSNKSVKLSPTPQHATKTEMLLARRQHSLLSTTQSDEDEETKPKCIVTTV